jgi:ornithine cyclodeaminase
MPGALAQDGYFGAKLVSVFKDPMHPGRSGHRGVVALFEPRLGSPVCIADAEEITLIRTASASALATDVLSRPESSVLAILGTGHQAIAHVSAIACVRKLSRVVLWGRTRDRANRAMREIEKETSLKVQIAEYPEAAVRDADIVCTATGAATPILFGRWLKPGMHINLVGSSGPATAEADDELVRRASYFVESRQTALAQAGELLNAIASGAVTESHIRAEIGEVLLGRKAGRTSANEVTVYKSLGHSVQDLASAVYLYERLAGVPRAEGNAVS